MGKTGGKGISYFGLVAMGIGCMLGTSWLLLTGTWLETAGGPLNLVVAFALCIIIELPFAFAYMEAIPMLPLPGGEVVYSYAAFGSRGGFAVGWAGILMNTIVFCWVDLAAVSLLDELFPVLGRTAVLYELGDFPVTLPNVAIQLALAGAILWVQLRGANVCASLAKLATVVLLIMCAVGLAVCFTHFDPAVYASDGGLDFDFAGSASLLSLLVFSVAGWETVSKAAADASGPAARKAGAALITCLFLVTGILCLVSTAVAGCMPWREAVGRTAPFADVLVSITGVPAVRVLFLATAFVGAVGVMNSTLYSSAQMLYGLSRFALVSRAFSALHPKYGTPARCIWFTAAFVVLTPFTGRLLLSALHQHRFPGHHRHVDHVPGRGAPPAARPAGPPPPGAHARRAGDGCAGGGRLRFSGGQHPSPVQPRRAGRPGVRPGRRPGRPGGPPLRVPRPYPVRRSAGGAYLRRTRTEVVLPFFPQPLQNG